MARANHVLDVLLVQFEQCSAEIRNSDTLIWQIPSIAMAINSFFGIAYLQYAETLIEKTVLLVVALLFTSVSIITLKKHRFFQVARTEDAVNIQNQFLELTGDTYQLRWQTKEIMEDREQYPDVDRCCLNRLSAYQCLLCVLCLTDGFIALLLLSKVVQILY